MDLAAFDKKRKNLYGNMVAGVDEAGRGPLAGPVTACACILPEDHCIVGLNDSKKLSERQREFLFQQLTTHPKVLYAIGIVEPEEIDRINIFQATIQAMLQAVYRLAEQPSFLLVDGLALPHPEIGCEKIIKGDAQSASIAAASILAKVTRDKIMLEYEKKWPEYGFAKHKGYGTQKHRDILAKIGPCPIHRKTFEPIKSLLFFI